MKQPWKYQKCKKLCFETRGRVLIILLSSLTPKVLNECLKFVILWALAVYVFTTENIFFPPVVRLLRSAGKTKRSRAILTSVTQTNVPSLFAAFNLKQVIIWSPPKVTWLFAKSRTQSIWEKVIACDPTQTNYFRCQKRLKKTQATPSPGATPACDELTAGFWMKECPRPTCRVCVIKVNDDMN